MPHIQPEPTSLVTPSLLAYAGVIARIGLTSFGGGVSGWLMRIVVHEQGWVTETEFLSGLALCQVFPGINVLNLSIWLGYRMHGGVGALVGALAMIVPPGIVLLGIAALFARLADQPALHAVLNGVAAAAIGLTASTGLRALRRAATSLAPAAVAAVTFAAVGVLHWPLVPVVAAVAPISVGLAAWLGASSRAG